MDTQTIERTTLSNLIYNENYARKVLPFIKGKYFEVREERIIFEEISNFVDKYKKIPTQTTLEIEVGERKDLSEKIGILLSILLKKNSAINSEENETSEDSQSLTKAAS